MQLLMSQANTKTKTQRCGPRGDLTEMVGRIIEIFAFSNVSPVLLIGGRKQIGCHLIAWFHVFCLCLLLESHPLSAKRTCIDNYQLLTISSSLISHKDSDYESVTSRSTEAHKFTQSDQLLRISKWTVAISILKSIVFEFVSMDSILYDIIEQVSL